MKLTSEQIERLYQFTRQHYVEYYDLQTELVDHLANAIEVQLVENPELNFEEALQIEYKKFGVFGFMDVLKERQKTLNKRYNKLVWKHFKEFFTLPKIVITLLSFTVLFILFVNFKKSFIIVQIIFVALLVGFWVGLINRMKKHKKEVRITGKKWLFQEIINGYSALTGLSYLPVQIVLQFDNYIINYNTNKALFFAIFVVIMCLIEYIVLFEIPSKAEEYLKETYPEYSLLN